MRVKFYSADNKRWRLPWRVPFEFERGIKAYDVVGYREPRRGEYYLSGAVVCAYRAAADFAPGNRMIVVRRTWDD